MNEELKAKLQYLKNGSGIHIKKKNRGKFTDYCGGKVTSECIARGKASSNPAIRKRATFAANARKWKHENGGIIAMQRGYNMPQIIDYSAFNPAKRHVFQYVDKQLQGAGYDYFPRLAILSSIDRESKGNPLAENGPWQGLLQWNGDRYRFNSQDSTAELSNQTRHLLLELKKSGWNGNKELQKKFLTAENIQDANDAFVDGFVRPGNREREKQIRYDTAIKGLTNNRGIYTTYDSSLPGIPGRFQAGGSLIYGKQENDLVSDGLIYKPLATPKQETLTFSNNVRYPVEPVSITTPIVTPRSTTTSSTATSSTTPTQSTQAQEITQPAQVTQPVQPTASGSEEWTEGDLGILNSDGSNKDKQRITNKYLREKLGLTKEQAAALVGIWQAESNFKLDAANQAEKAGKNSSVKSSQYGIGIGQWTHSRHDDFVNYINTHGGNYSLKNQLDFAIEEIKTKYPEFLSNLRSASNVKDATAYAYVQYVGANERNIKDISDLYARVNKTVNRYRQKHLELYGKATNGFEQRLKFANDSLNIS